MIFKGNVWKFGKNINTDVIMPARYINVSDPKELGLHCMEDIDSDFVKNIFEGDIIVAEENFGCGSSREHAPVSIKAAGISCIIAKSFARIFFQMPLILVFRFWKWMILWMNAQQKIL